MKIQIIGLPGSGKTTQIKRYLKDAAEIDLFDLRNFSGKYRDQLFRTKILNHKGRLLAESACGVPSVGYVIKINPPLPQVYAQLLARDNYLDEDYLSLLGTQMIAADCTLTRPEDLPGLLKTILKG